MSTVTNDKNCYCLTCKKAFHYLGITAHRAAHRRRKEDCEIRFTDGAIFSYYYKDKKEDKG